mmetsp:Transcript_56719/g.120433  ORF Transcript_56719/g.120433 Transcript_56719/m.120433 type:complete len:228 (-) Transcript_56719:27-710(-)
MKIHSVKRKLVRQLQPHHDHPRHPEKEDVQSSLEKRGRIERLQVICMIWPSHHREGEEARGKPCVEDVRIPLKHDLVATTPQKLFSLDVCILLTPGHHPTIIALHIRLDHAPLSLLGREPCRNLMSPPKLPAHAPIANVVQPLKPRLLMVSGDNLQLPIAHRIRGPFRHAATVHIPLGRDHRLEDVSGAGAKAQAHLVGLLPNVKPLLLERLLHSDTGIVTHHPLEL